MKIATGIVEPEQVRRVRIHGVPRAKMMTAGESMGSPTGCRKVTIFRGVSEDGKLGPIQHREDEEEQEHAAELPTKWVGATVFFRPLPVE